MARARVEMPALFTRTSMRPKEAIAASMRAGISSSFSTSNCTTLTLAGTVHRIIGNSVRAVHGAQTHVLMPL